jgi:tetratricopeptide (TPR) repeat protein
VRSLVFAVGLAAANAIFAAPPGVTEIRQAERQCQTAIRALQTGNYDKADEGFAKALALAPDYPPAHMGLGHVALARKDFEGGLREYTAGRDAYGQYGAALHQIEMERYAKTQDEIRKLQDQLRDMHNQARGPDAEGGLSTNQQNMERTIEQRIQTLQAVPMPTASADPGPPADVYFHMGNALFRLERYDEARVAWETCAQKNTKFPLVQNNLAVLYMKAGRFEEARHAVAEAERLGMTVNPGLKADIDRLAVQKR